MVFTSRCRQFGGHLRKFKHIHKNVTKSKYSRRNKRSRQNKRSRRSKRGGLFRFIGNFFNKK